MDTERPDLVRKYFIVSLAILIVCGPTSSSIFAGGGPENICIVVNERSWASKTIANYFCALRKVPPQNVIYIDWKGNLISTNVESFRQQIIHPVLSEIDQRGIGGHIDYIVYSSDFPYSVEFSSDLQSKERFSVGSITGLTYLSPLVMLKRPIYFSTRTNWYMQPWTSRGDDRIKPVPESRGFRSHYSWSLEGARVEEGGLHYVLSTMLGYTSGRGNSVREVIRYLARSLKADGTIPSGTIYLMRNNGVRSRVRDFCFDAVANELRALGVGAEILEGVIPHEKRDVLGAVIGANDFKWNQSGSEILPGAICENFTSYGGILRGDAPQVPLTELLRYGSAGSSGTVVEPYSLIEKFPSPMIQVHYARGCSLAEAYFQSVSSPYQLLIVGDPLCQPWAVKPNVRVKGLRKREQLRGRVALAPSSPTLNGVRMFEIFVDGARVGRLRSGSEFELDTAGLGDGSHELRVVAYEDTLIETQGHAIIPFVAQNHGRTIDVNVTSQRRVRWDELIRLNVEAPGANQIIVMHNQRVLDRIDGDSGELTVEASQLGMGPVDLYVVGLGPGGNGSHVVARPFRFHVQEPNSISAVRVEPAQLAKGLRLMVSQGRKITIVKTTDSDWLEQAGVNSDESFTLDGYFRVDNVNLFQFQLGVVGTAEISINGHQLFRKDEIAYRVEHVPVTLSSGWHHMNLQVDLSGAPRASIAFGSKGTRALDSGHFYHLR